MIEKKESTDWEMDKLPKSGRYFFGPAKGSCYQEAKINHNAKIQDKFKIKDKVYAVTFFFSWGVKECEITYLNKKKKRAAFKYDKFCSSSAPLERIFFTREEAEIYLKTHRNLLEKQLPSQIEKMKEIIRKEYEK